MGYYSPETIELLKIDLDSIKQKRYVLNDKFIQLSSILVVEKAKEYLLHGTTRRLGIVVQCIDNIYSVFPPERDQFLSVEELKEVDINLHSFFINVYGFLDNLAWVFVLEKEINIHKNEVGMFLPKTKVNFKQEFREYIESSPVKRWFEEYLKDYRDTLSHRIPLYVPPKLLTPDQIQRDREITKELNKNLKMGDFNAVDILFSEQENLGSIAPIFRHSVYESNGFVLHPQIIIDFKTIEVIAIKYLEMFGI